MPPCYVHIKPFIHPSNGKCVVNDRHSDKHSSDSKSRVFKLQLQFIPSFRHAMPFGFSCLVAYHLEQSTRKSTSGWKLSIPSYRSTEDLMPQLIIESPHHGMIMHFILFHIYPSQLKESINCYHIIS